ncbi:MAG TPA: hypothetical protein VFQ65_15780 [Kofleriaceae bacterium]|nr:hypothetical protein [Kofleriaceae bacterium]
MSDRDDIDDIAGDLAPEEHALVAKLRALPGEGREPDWSQLEREIAGAVGPRVPLPWWRTWRWLVPAAGLAALAVIALFVMHHPTAPTVAVTRPDAGSAPAPVAEAAPPTSADTALWLDGQAVDVGDVDPTLLLLDDSDGADELADDSGTLLPADDLRWIDSLDDHALDRAEHWLKKKGHAPG